MYLFKLSTFQCHLWLHLIINYYIREFMVLSLLASYAMHKLFHKISNCISESKNSSIVHSLSCAISPLAFMFSGGVKETAKISHFVDCDWENAWKWLEWHVFRVWGMLNPMLQVLSLCNEQFLKKHNFRQKFHILLILTGKNALKVLEWCIFRVQGMLNPMALVASLWWVLHEKSQL